MALTLTELAAICHGVKATQLASWVLPLNASMQRFGIESLRTRQMFLATVVEESGSLQRLDENMNYSAEALCRTWPTRFKSLAEAQPYHRQPIKIANKVYALRMGNGDEKSGDGYRYRGAGLIQLTGKANQAACAKYFGKRLEDMPAWLRTHEGACMSAAWYWSSRGCQDFAEHDDFDGVCDIVNIGKKTTKEGDAIGFLNRLAHLRRIKTILKA
jgi:putative chitinase